MHRRLAIVALASLTMGCPQDNAGQPPATGATATPAPTASASAKTPASGAAFCYGTTELTSDQRRQLQMQYDEGKDPCPGWLAPTVMIGPRGITLNGQQLVLKDKLPEADQLVKLEPLVERLNLFRKRWKSIIPNKRFAGRLSVKPVAGVPSSVGVSVLLAGAWAGYVPARVRTEQGAVEFDQNVPSPPRPGPGPRMLFVEPLEGGKAVVGFVEPGPKLRDKKQLTSMDELESWLQSSCGKGAPSPCVEVLALRLPKGTFENAMRVLHSVLKIKPLADQPPSVRLQFGCKFPPTQHKDADDQGPWGPRTPDKPCF